MVDFDSGDFEAASVALEFAARLVGTDPDGAWMRQCVDDGLFGGAPFGEGDSAVADGLAMMDLWCRASRYDADNAAASLRRERLRLFVGLGSPEASINESFYVEPNSPLFGRCTLAVRSCYREWNLCNERQRHEPDDRLDIMLAFCAFLMREAHRASCAGDSGLCKRALRSFESFLVAHMLPWASAWRFLVRSHAKTDYYRGVGEFVFGLERACAGRLGIGFHESSGAFSYVVPSVGTCDGA